MGKLQIGVIACRVLDAEVKHFAEAMPQVIEVNILEQGLHNEPDKLRIAVQEAVDVMEERDDITHIVMVYGLCSRGIEGVSSRRYPLVMARAHDCITLLLGSRKRYAEYLDGNLGTYWFSVGWNRAQAHPSKELYDEIYKSYLDDYDEDDAKYLLDIEMSWIKEYNLATFIDSGVGDCTAAIEQTKKSAKWLGWNFDKQIGDNTLLKKLLSGEWNDDEFLILSPGQTAKLTTDENVVVAVDSKKTE